MAKYSSKTKNGTADQKEGYSTVHSCCARATADGFPMSGSTLAASRNVAPTNNSLHNLVHLLPEMVGYIGSSTWKSALLNVAIDPENQN